MRNLLLGLLLAAPTLAHAGNCHQLYVIAANRDRARLIQASLGGTIEACVKSGSNTVNYLTWADDAKSIAFMVEEAAAKGYLTIAVDGTLPTNSRIEKAIAAARKKGLNAFRTKENAAS